MTADGAPAPASAHLLDLALDVLVAMHGAGGCPRPARYLVSRVTSGRLPHQAAPHEQRTQVNTRSGLDFEEVEASIGRFEFDGAHAQLDLLAAAATLDADRARVEFSRAVLLVQEGVAAEACEILLRLIRRHPDRRDFWRSYLTALKGLDIPDAAFVGAHRLYAARFINDEVPSPAPHRQCSASSLHIGYVGPDGHMAILRFLRHLPHSRHKSSFLLRNRAMAERLKREFPALSCLILPDDVAAACNVIRAAGVDVLVDLCGHGRGGALEVLARHPAPLIATWLDYLATTGVPAISYRITDWAADPPGNERLHTEQLARLPFASWCYAPSAEAPEVRPCGGPIVLGSACIPLKMSGRTLALWRRTLEALPEARFELVGFPSTASRERVRQALGAEVAARTTLHGRLPMASYLAIIDTFHVALDAVGFSGGTSTLDCLWQGVPVVTAPGTLSHSRSSTSMLEHLDLGRLVARSENEYVAIACDTARSDFDRAGLRARLAKSPLCDAAKFARGFDDLISSLWARSGLDGCRRSPGERAVAMALAHPLDAGLRRSAFHALRDARA
jgi:protein O-GlcNAc transferase